MAIKVSNGFNSTGRMLETISKRMMSNDHLMKLLYYPSAAPWKEPDFNATSREDAYTTCIRLIPKMEHEEFKRAFVVVMFNGFKKSSNPAYRKSNLVIDVVVPLEMWRMSNKMLRPYAIMAEIDNMFCDEKLDGIGRSQFVSANAFLLSDEYAGFTLTYELVNEV